ncbi:hypothetical protein LZ30DRAFT_702488 [Colletotrichum cereale]|nr:hypothetical protein LZ30DRAFT_702488 [Colletotrichum cereale]
MPCLLIQVQRYGRAQKTKDQGTVLSLTLSSTDTSILVCFFPFLHTSLAQSLSFHSTTWTCLFYTTLPALRLPRLTGLTSPFLPPPYLYLDLFRGAPLALPYLFSPTQPADRPQLPPILLPIEYRSLLDLEGGFFLSFSLLLSCHRNRETNPTNRGAPTSSLPHTSLIQPCSQTHPPPRPDTESSPPICSL